MLRNGQWNFFFAKWYCYVLRTVFVEKSNVSNRLERRSFHRSKNNDIDFCASSSFNSGDKASSKNSKVSFALEITRLIEQYAHLLHSFIIYL